MSNGPQIKDFDDKKFADYYWDRLLIWVLAILGTGYLLTIIAIQFCIGLGAEDEILVQANTFIGSVSGASE